MNAAVCIIRGYSCHNIKQATCVISYHEILCYDYCGIPTLELYVRILLVLHFVVLICPKLIQGIATYLLMTRFGKTDHFGTTSEMHFIAPYHRYTHALSKYNDQ